MQAQLRGVPRASWVGPPEPGTSSAARRCVPRSIRAQRVRCRAARSIGRSRFPTTDIFLAAACYADADRVAGRAPSNADALPGAGCASPRWRARTRAPIRMTLRDADGAGAPGAALRPILPWRRRCAWRRCCKRQDGDLVSWFSGLMQNPSWPRSGVTGWDARLATTRG